VSHKVKVLSVLKLSEIHLAALRAVSPCLQVEQITCREPESITPLVREVEVLYTYHVPFVPADAPRLRWIQLSSAGADHLVESPILDSPVIITTASGIHAVPIAEFVLGSMIAWSRKFSLLQEYQQQHKWPAGRWPVLRGHELRDKTLGIVGYGSIGREIARLASAFGMRILASKRATHNLQDQGYFIPGTGDPDGLLPAEVYSPERLPEMLSQCDFVVITVPLTPQTRKLIGEAELRAMPSHACLINVARGEVVDEPTLIRALQEGWIAGAVLDVFEEEPLSADSPLWNMDNVLITPHIAGATFRYDDRAVALFAENLRRYLAGEPLLNVVNPRLLY